MLGSALDLFNFKALRRHPALLALALLPWMVPLASILPPATLSVAITTREERAYSHVPVPQFVGTEMAKWLDTVSPPGLTAEGTLEGPAEVSSQYQKPSRQLLRLVTSTAFRGAVPDHQTPHPNSTYVLSFPGPALSCQSISPDLLQQLSVVTNCSFPSNSSNTKSKAECENAVTYLSWVPGESLNDDGGEYLIPFTEDEMVDGVLPLEPLTGSHTGYHDPRYNDGITGGAATVNIATRSQKLPYNPENWDLLNCSMYNASYVVKVTSDSNSQGILSKPDIRTLNRIPLGIYTSLRPVNTPPPMNQLATLSYLAVMESLNRLLIGTIVGDPGARVRDTWYWDEESLNVQNQGLTQTLIPFTKELLPFLGKPHLLVGYDGEIVQPLDVKQWTLVDDQREHDGFVSERGLCGVNLQQITWLSRRRTLPQHDALPLQQSPVSRRFHRGHRDQIQHHAEHLSLQQQKSLHIIRPRNRFIFGRQHCRLHLHLLRWRLVQQPLLHSAEDDQRAKPRGAGGAE